jgi:sugar transferase (PEP-CTERM/EpsH1 system associated)
MTRRVLYIAHRRPYPPDKGERVRAFHEITALAKHFRVTLAALAHDRGDADAASPLKQWCEKVIVAPGGGRKGLLKGALSFLRGGSVTEGFFRSTTLRRAVLAEAEREPFDLVMAYSSGVLPMALEVPAPRHVIDLVDVDSVKWASYADASVWPKSWLYHREARGVRALEMEALERCDAVLLVSDAEVRALGVRSDKVFAVGNGVDAEYFAPRRDTPSNGKSLVFTGSMDYRPNVEGVCCFVRDVWPGLKECLPDLTLTIVGRNPARAVMQLENFPGVRVTGSVPDVRPYLAGAAVAVAPLTIARGIQNKVLEAMAMGRAVVASGAALEGLDVTPGEDVLQADTTQEWHDRITELLSNGNRRSRLEESARKCVEAHYDLDARMEPLVSLCKRLADSGGRTEDGGS